ncbi:MAG: 1,4-alpha-glucan branching protein GlgB [Actinomycetota bacterium]|nr:1,4-alpha-glucan branching protein GlgB [Actinomycetota bacterium]
MAGGERGRIASAGETNSSQPATRALGLSELDLYLFNEGRHFELYDHLGAHPLSDGSGASFAVWAPNAAAVSVVHDGNGWTPGADALGPQGSSGVWAGAVGGLPPGTRYKYRIEPRSGPVRDKADPFAFRSEEPPLTASVYCPLEYSWKDADWVSKRPRRQADGQAMSIYEVHLGSWRRRPDGSWLTYGELAEQLADHVSREGFSHVELLPVMEHPFYGSWGYQTTGYFAPTARYGAPAAFMGFVDHLHQRGIGVILDWVPSHFATDEFGLGEFDGTHLYEHEDPRRRVHPDWGSYEFNYGRHEVRSFLISSAWFWLDRYHVDGLRVDAVASMLYLDYSREAGGFVPNRYGGRENLDAVEFLRQFNDSVHERFPGVVTVAEESTAWPGVSHPSAAGGLGFSMKWDMGWMHDTLQHLSREPIHRRYHYGELTFRGLYAFSERFVLPLSHDEVVHGKGALATKMPGDDWQRRATLRLLLALQWFQPGKKLLFMGGELATWKEWNHDDQLEWDLLEHPEHAGVAALVSDLNRLYATLEPLHGRDFDSSGFEWVIADDEEDGVLSWRRTGAEDGLLVVANTTPIVREGFRIGVPENGCWEELCNTDAFGYGGSGVGNLGRVDATPDPAHGYPASVVLRLPPLGALLLAPTRVGSTH